MAPNTRQWFISFPFPLRYLFAAYPQAMGKVLSIVYRAISTHPIHKAGLESVAKANGFSLHAGVSCEGHQKDKADLYVLLALKVGCSNLQIFAPTGSIFGAVQQPAGR
jgi:hypothetical protein